MEERNLYEPEAEQGEGINVASIINKVVGLWPWMLVCGLLAGCLGYAYLYFVTPEYKINAKILIKDDDKKGTGGSDVGMLKNMGLLGGASNVDNELEIFNSYTLMKNTVEELGLNVMLFTRSGFKEAEVYGVEQPLDVVFMSYDKTAFAQKPDNEYELGMGKEGVVLTSKLTKKQLRGAYGQPIKLPVGEAVFAKNPNFVGKLAAPYTLKVYLPESVTMNYMASLQASIPNKQVSTISLTLSNSIPARGEAVLNTLMRLYMKANVDDNNRIADSTMAFIDTRLAVVSDQLGNIEKQIQGFKQRNEVADLGAQAKMLIDNTGDYAKQIAQQQVQLQVIESLESYMLENSNNPRVLPASLVLQDPTLTELMAQYNKMLLTRSRLLFGSTESNPIVQNMDAQLRDLRADMLRAIASVKREARAAMASLRSSAGNLEAQVRAVPEKERIALDYGRQQQIRQELYLFLLQKREETAISRSSMVANARIIDAARSERVPFKPKRGMVLAMSVLVGLALPFAFVSLRNAINTRIGTKHETETLSAMPIIGEIGHSDKGHPLAVSAGGREIIDEQFRVLRTNLQFLLRASPGSDKVVLLTSSMGGEGKSFIAINLATVLSLGGKKVILLEMDLRKPRLVSGLGLLLNKGFSQYAIGQEELSSVIFPSGVNDNLFILPAGTIPPNPTELLLLERTRKMFAQLKEEYDYIVVDTAPNLVTDAQILGQQADVTLYVVRLNVTRKEQLRLPGQLYKEGKLPKLSLVVNDIKQKKYGGGYYGYGHKYGYGEYIDLKQ
ncbi:MAG: polysaccharide biosynthesis tyrosine autokinase [Edaphocola sp.]